MFRHHKADSGVNFHVHFQFIAPAVIKPLDPTTTVPETLNHTSQYQKHCAPPTRLRRKARPTLTTNGESKSQSQEQPQSKEESDATEGESAKEHLGDSIGRTYAVRRQTIWKEMLQP
jgi:hypothetical protein